MVLLGSISSVSAQAVTYLENFTTANNNSSAFFEYNWGAIASNGTTNTTANSTVVVFQSSSSAGPQTTLAGVNNTGNFTTPTNGAAGSGFMYMPTTSFDRALAFTRPDVEYFGANRTLSSADLAGLSVQTGSSSNGQIRPAILVGSTWYVLSTSLSAGSAANAAAFTGTAGQTQSWDINTFVGTDWAVLDTTTPGFSIAGTTAALPVGNVNSVGFYYTSVLNSGTQRFDNFTLTTVPEPGTIALLLGAGLLFAGPLLRRARRRA